MAFKVFEGCPAQILIGPFLNTWNQLVRRVL